MRMKHAGEARRACFRIISWTLIAIVVMAAMAFVGKYFASLILILCPFLAILWVIFALFTLYFFRDPNPRPLTTAGLVVSPGHGKVDVVDQCRKQPASTPFLGGRDDVIEFLFFSLSLTCMCKTRRWPERFRS